MASSALSCEPATTTVLPLEVHPSARETVLPIEPIVQQEVENFLEPLVFVWDEDRFVVSEAIQSYLALFNADH